MEYVTKLELLVLDWLKKLKLPQLPKSVRVWIATNVWWMALIVAILLGIRILFVAGTLFTLLGFMASTAALWVVAGASIGLTIISSIVSIVFTGLQTLVTALAVNPLKAKQKKGWVLLFVGLLLYVVSVAVNVLLDLIGLNPFGVIGGLIFGAIFTAIGAYFIYEIRDEFAHVSKSHGVKAEAAKK